MTRTYQGPDGLCGFTKGHEYVIEISKKPNEPYEIEATFDNTDFEVVDLYLVASSRISIDRNFRKEAILDE